MNKTFRILMIVAAAFIGIGILMAGLSFSFGFALPDLFYEIGNKNHEAADRTIEEDLKEFQDISIDASYHDVRFKQGDAFHIKYSYNSKYSSLTHEIKEGRLLVKDEKADRKGLLSVIGEKNLRGMIEITYPKEAVFRDVRIADEIGEVAIGDFSCSNLQIDVGIGSIVARAVKTQTLQISADTGDVKLVNGSADRAELELSLGELTTDKWSTNGLVAELGSGEANLSGTFLGETNIDCTIGDITMQVSDFEKNYAYDLETELGDIRINGKKVANEVEQKRELENKINLSAETGDINLSFEK